MNQKLKILSFTGQGIACSFALPEIHKTLARIGHEVLVVDIGTIEDVVRRDTLVIENTLAFEPDIILTIDIIGLVIAHFLSVPPLKIVSLFFDNPNTHFTPSELMLTMNNYFVFSIDREFVRQSFGAHLHYTPWYYDPDYFQDLGLDRIYDVSFIGHHNDYREKLFQRLADQVKINIWGDDKWTAVDHPNICFHGFAHPRKDAPTIYNRSKMVISLNAEQFSDGISERLYNIMACGALALTNTMPVIREHFTVGEELIVFHDPQDLAGQIDGLLNNASRARQIAENGKQKVARSFTCERFLDAIINQVLQTDINLHDYQRSLQNFIDHVAPACWDAYDFVGRIAYRQGLYDKACHHFTRAVEIDGTKGNSFLGQISSLLKTGKPEKAFQQYRKLCQIDDEKGALAKKLFTDNADLHFEM